MTVEDMFLMMAGIFLVMAIVLKFIMIATLSDGTEKRKRRLTKKIDIRKKEKKKK